VDGTFYPSTVDRLERLVAALYETADALAADGGGLPTPTLPAGLLVPHAGLVYSGVTAAAGWRLLRGEPAPVVVLLGTNHGAGWLDGVGAWDAGSWSIPGAEMAVDDDLVDEVVALGSPFTADPAAHVGEHSIEVQLPLLAAVAPRARIVPLAVSCGTGARAVVAGGRLGHLLAERRAAGEPVVLVVSTDMAHYPPADVAAAITKRLLPPILALDATTLAASEREVRASHAQGVACGMCGIEPAVLGLAALRAMGSSSARALSATTSADAGGETGRTVGYLAVRFDA
jgi:MEMO1 family protein